MPENVNRTENDIIDQIREAAESDLETFIRLVMPQQVFGSIHTELCRWWMSEKRSNHTLLLMPRDHQKSRYAAFYTAWLLTRDPTIRILYVSATANLAEKQLSFIKQIITSKIYRKYWPDHVNVDEGKREKWTNSEISLDHPKRKEEAVRDPTIFTGGLTTSLTGLHCDVAVLDDVVVYENAYTEEGRTKVKSQYSLLSSIEGAEAREIVVGTRYHPSDLYNDLMNMKREIYDPKTGEPIDEEPIYDVFQRQVEDVGDGSGQFLWPRQQRKDGKWFGFDRGILNTKRNKYLDQTQFRAQYYNDPNDSGEANITRDLFQYYDKKYLNLSDGFWYYKDKKLNIIASVDFAYSLSRRADYTTICVAGIDSERNIYILDIDRFKSTKISEYYKHIFDLYTKWSFRKLVAEVTAAQRPIVEDIKDNYIKPNGLVLSIIEHKPTKHQGSKEERMQAVLDPMYNNMQVWHYQGGNCQTLEDELVLLFPPHDDCKDALTSCVQYLVPPVSDRLRQKSRSAQIITHPRFGGVLSV